MVVLHEKMRENHALYFHIYCVKVVCVVSTHILCEKHASFFLLPDTCKDSQTLRRFGCNRAYALCIYTWNMFIKLESLTVHVFTELIITSISFRCCLTACIEQGSWLHNYKEVHIERFI